MPWSLSKISEALLASIGSPTKTGTICERPGLDFLGIKTRFRNMKIKYLHDWDILSQELGFDVPDVDLLELTVTNVFPLVGDTSAGASDVGRG